MTISRRLALTGGSSLVALGGLTGSGFASGASFISRRKPIYNFRNTQTAQRFMALLIHRDEARHVPHYAEISIPAADTGWYAVDTLDDVTYRMTNTRYKKQGYRLKRITAFKTKEGVRYSGCWELASGPDWHSVHGMTLAAFNKTAADYANKGYRMSFVDSRANYAGVWESGDPGTQSLLTGLTVAQFEQQSAALVGQGYQPLRISAEVQSGMPYFTGLFEKNLGISWQSRHAMSATDFKKANAAMIKQGYRLTDASGYALGIKPMFNAVWEQIA